MSPKFVNVNHRQPMLLPPDLRDWVPEDDLVHFIITAVEGLDLNTFVVNQRGTGSPQYPPHMMLALLVYCYANGIFSSRRIERATYRDVGVRYLTANTHPDHDTIAKFRRENFEAVVACFVKVLELAREAGVLKVGTVSVDGTKMRANASKHRSIRYDRAGELIEQLEEEVQELMAKAERSDQEDGTDGQSLPKELSRREQLKAKLEQARARIEARAKGKAEAERAEYERRVREREKRRGSAKGKRIKKPDAKPEPKAQDNLTDPDSRLMRRSKSSSYEQAYNAQAVVDADGSQLVLGARVSQCASDRNELVADVEAIPRLVGMPSTVLGDNGYLNEEEVRQLQGEEADPQMEVLISVHAEAKQLRRKHDFRPRSPVPRDGPVIRSDFVREMKEKMTQEEGRKKYRLRKQTVEPVFGIIKGCMGFTQFHLRGHPKVTGEWVLVTLAYNVKRLWRLIGARELELCPR